MKAGADAGGALDDIKEADGDLARLPGFDERVQMPARWRTA